MIFPWKKLFETCFVFSVGKIVNSYKYDRKKEA